MYIQRGREKICGWLHSLLWSPPPPVSSVGESPEVIVDSKPAITSLQSVSTGKKMIKVNYKYNVVAIVLHLKRYIR